MKTGNWTSLLVATAFALISAGAGAQGYGPGMMGGYGPGMMGPGMMGGYGQGMMGGYGAGYGMGPGMMGGYGPGMMGPGMMAGYGLPDLTADQRARLADIQEKFGQRHWDLMGKMHQQGFRFNDLYRGGKLNEQAARKHYETMVALHKQMFESWLQAQKEMDALLTPEQRKEYQRRWQGR